MAGSPQELDQPTLLLNAYVDGELDPANALAMEQRIAAEPWLAREHDRLVVLRRVLRERLPPEPAPPSLRARIDRDVSATARPQPVGWRSLAASVAVAAALSSGATWFALQPVTGTSAMDAVLAGHIRALMAPQPTDIASSDRHVVRPWFNGRVPNAPRVVDLSNDGFPLVGGRVDVVGHAVVPTLVYHHRQHLISLVAVPGTGTIRSAPTTQGYNVVTWSSDGIGYWAISDLGAGDLNKFVQLFRAAPTDR